MSNEGAELNSDTFNKAARHGAVIWRNLLFMFFIHICATPVIGGPIEQLTQVFRNNTNLTIGFERVLLWEANMPKEIELTRNGRKVTLRRKPANLYWTAYSNGNFVSFNFSDFQYLTEWRSLRPTNIYSGIGLHGEKAWSFTSPPRDAKTAEIRPVQLQFFTGELSEANQSRSGYFLERREMFESVNFAPSSALPGSIKFDGRQFVGKTQSGSILKGIVREVSESNAVIAWNVESQFQLLCRYHFRTTNQETVLYRWERTGKNSFEKPTQTGDIAYNVSIMNFDGAEKLEDFLPYQLLSGVEYIEFFKDIETGETHYESKMTGELKKVREPSGKQKTPDRSGSRGPLLALIMIASVVTLATLIIFSNNGMIKQSCSATHS